MDVSTAARFALGLKDAEHFYTAPITGADAGGWRRGGGLGWSKKAFKEVAWEELDAVLARKGQMYQQWLSKQSSKFYSTQSMVARWDTMRDEKCLDCGQQETASYLNLCPNLDRTKLLHDMADKLGKWLDNNYTHLELAYWIPPLIKLRGTHLLSYFPLHSPAMARVAASQELILWKAHGG